jgi:hypothetical protein
VSSAEEIAADIVERAPLAAGDGPGRRWLLGAIERALGAEQASRRKAEAEANRLRQMLHDIRPLAQASAIGYRSTIPSHRSTVMKARAEGMALGAEALAAKVAELAGRRLAQNDTPVTQSAPSGA